MNQVMPASMRTRNTSASDRPMRRAISLCSGGMRATMTEMNTTLSMPSTTSIALNAMKLAQICGSVSQSNIGHTNWGRSAPAPRSGLMALRSREVHMLNRRSLCRPVEQRTKRADAGEAGRGCGEQHFDPERRWKRIGDGADGGDRPQSRDEPGEGAQLRDTEGMHRENRHEGERDKKCNDGEPDEWRGLECKNRGRRHSRWRGSRRSSLPSSCSLDPPCGTGSTPRWRCRRGGATVAEGGQLGSKQRPGP